MNAEQLEKIRQIHAKPQKQWKRSDWSKVYWFHYHEMDDPTEGAIRWLAMWCGHIGNTKWWVFLLERFPSEENYLRMVRRIGTGHDMQRQAIFGVIRKLLEVSPISQKHIDLARKYGSKKVRKMAMRVNLGHYEI
jgi:hypothetical protein